MLRHYLLTLGVTLVLTITLPSALRATFSVQTMTVLKVNNGVKISPRVASMMEEGPTSMLVWML